MYVAKTKQELAKLLLKDTRKNSFFTRSDVVPRMLELPVCPKCGRPAFKDKGWGKSGVIRCVTAGCGWSGSVDKTYSLEMHLMDGGG